MIFDTRNPFKSPRNTSGWTDGRTYVLTHTIKAVPNDQCGSVRKVLSVRRRQPRFARPPGAFDPTPADSLRSSADRGSSRSAFDLRTLLDGRTHTIYFLNLTPFLRKLRKLRHWSLRDQRRTATTSCERHQSKVTL